MGRLLKRGRLMNLCLQNLQIKMTCSKIAIYYFLSTICFQSKYMRKTFSVTFLSAIIALIAGCSSAKKNRSSVEVTGSWVNKEKASGKSYNSVFILVLTENLETRTVL